MKSGSSTIWRESAKGIDQYHAIRAEAQRLANETGFDYGLEANDLLREWRIFMLPMKQNRRGHELRREVVSCEVTTKCQKGHGCS